jgi:hypothetical protein
MAAYVFIVNSVLCSGQEGFTAFEFEYGIVPTKTICRSKVAKIGNRFNIPYEDVGHVIRLACIAAYKDSLCD